MSKGIKQSLNIDEEWSSFISGNYEEDSENEEYIEHQSHADGVPICGPIYISTKTKISYLNQAIDLNTVFWNIPVLDYSTPKNGVIKKQMKFNSLSLEELNIIKEKVKLERFCDEYVLTSIDNPNGRIKFKDIRKISVGISKKDLMTYRCKQKSAFYNCFVLILRIKINEDFKEFHVKVFNTGKLEIPGIQNDNTFVEILDMLVSILQPHISSELSYGVSNSETVLINSNFNCGFYINREILFDILKYKYNIQAIYDPCSYPGIQCKLYYNDSIILPVANSTVETVGLQEEYPKKINYANAISFMIFRTGSVLIVGKCEECDLYNIYEFLKKLLTDEHNKIYQKGSNVDSSSAIKDKKKKMRKKQILVSIV
jgi:hypothetical protein